MFHGHLNFKEYKFTVLETIENEELGDITCDYVLFYVIYGVWSWSLFQVC